MNNCVEVENSVDADIIVDKFASQFSSTYTHNNAAKAKELYDEYKCMRATYSVFPITDEHVIDTELVSNVIFRIHSGKAVDITGLTAEHLTHCHPSLSLVLCTLFKLVVQHAFWI